MACVSFSAIVLLDLLKPNSISLFLPLTLYIQGSTSFSGYSQIYLHIIRIVCYPFKRNVLDGPNYSVDCSVAVIQPEL